MAWMNQERKDKLTLLVRAVIPKDWKYSLRVRNNSTIVLTLRQAPVDLLQDLRNHGMSLPLETQNLGMSRYTADNFMSAPYRKVFNDIFDALNDGNHDKSDIQTDYFDVGWYVDVQIGEWDNPFLHVVPAPTKSKTQGALEAAQKSMHAKSNETIAAFVKKHKSYGKVFGTGNYEVSDKLKKKGIDLSALQPYLPSGWAGFTPGKKAQATKKAMKMAGLA